MPALSLLFYVPINLLKKRIVKKTVVLFAFAIFTQVFLFTAFTGLFGSSQTLKLVRAFLLIVFCSFPLAIFCYRLAAAVASGFCLFGGVLRLFYDEKVVLGA